MKAAVIINSPKQVGCVQLVQSAFREKACSSIDSGSVTNVYAQMAESVDALVSNTSGVKSIPVRSRVWVQERKLSI